MIEVRHPERCVESGEPPPTTVFRVQIYRANAEDITQLSTAQAKGDQWRGADRMKGTRDLPERCSSRNRSLA